MRGKSNLLLQRFFSTIVAPGCGRMRGVAASGVAVYIEGPLNFSHTPKFYYDAGHLVIYHLFPNESHSVGTRRHAITKVRDKDHGHGRILI